jgi:hypothetical protein
MFERTFACSILNRVPQFSISRSRRERVGVEMENVHFVDKGRGPMAVAVARIPEKARIPWTILAMVMKIESQDLTPKLEDFVENLKTFHGEIVALQETADKLLTTVESLLSEVELLKQDTAPLWDDSYNLCGNPECQGDCRICQEGEEDYEDVYEEKYCRRGRR